MWPLKCTRPSLSYCVWTPTYQVYSNTSKSLLFHLPIFKCYWLGFVELWHQTNWCKISMYSITRASSYYEIKNAENYWNKIWNIFVMCSVKQYPNRVIIHCNFMLWPSKVFFQFFKTFLPLKVFTNFQFGLTKWSRNFFYLHSNFSPLCIYETSQTERNWVVCFSFYRWH